MNRKVTNRWKAPAARWGLALLLACYCFLSLAVYTPLHTHGKAGSCTLNGFDHQWGATSTPVIAPWGLELLSWFGHQAQRVQPDTFPQRSQASRAPPANRIPAV
jgi:hypothetical protein